jgi:hypothetical protein
MTSSFTESGASSMCRRRGQNFIEFRQCKKGRELQHGSDEAADRSHPVKIPQPVKTIAGAASSPHSCRCAGHTPRTELHWGKRDGMKCRSELHAVYSGLRIRECRDEKDDYNRRRRLHGNRDHDGFGRRGERCCLRPRRLSRRLRGAARRRRRPPPCRRSAQGPCSSPGLLKKFL